MSIKDLVKDKEVQFVRCFDGALWYEVIGSDFQFPIAFAETKGGEFKAKDKALFYMRWIREHYNQMENVSEDS